MSDRILTDAELAERAGAYLDDNWDTFAACASRQEDALLARLAEAERLLRKQNEARFVGYGVTWPGIDAYFATVEGKVSG